jgi:DNA-binding beta-propeller fold protein YncE
MKQLLGLAVAVTLGASLAAQSVPEMQYDAKADVISLPSFGEVAGVATNSRGHVFVYARTGHGVATLGDERTFYHGGSRLFEFEESGKFVKEIGQGVYALNFAQQVRVDPQDNIWIVDAGSNALVKFAPDGRYLLNLGRKPENIGVRPGGGVSATVPDAEFLARPAPPAEGRGGRGGAPGAGGGRGGGANPGTGINGDSFNRPSDVTWDRAGNIYVADGFGSNSRIAKFNKDGDFLKTWGRTGSGQGEFRNIRGIVSDAAGNVYVADAGNNRIQVFDGEGAFKSQITNIGTPMAICITGGATQYLFTSNSNDAESMERGDIYKVGLNGQVVGKFGKAGRMAKEFGMTNSLDCRTDTDLWVGEVWNWRAQKVTLRK